MKLNVYGVSFIVICAAVLANADLNDVKKNGIRLVDAQVANIKKLTEDTSMEVEKREGNINVITKHAREFGDGIIDKTNFQITRAAKSAYMMANLLGSPNTVFRCIETREREGLEDSDKYYSLKFLTPGRDFETQAVQYQRNLIKAWKDDYYKAIDQYANIYQKAVADIQKASSESYVSSVVKNFEQTTKQMADIITNILPAMAKTHIQVLKTYDQLVFNLLQFSVIRVDESYKAIQKCFPKLYEKETFVNPFMIY